MKTSLLMFIYPNSYKLKYKRVLWKTLESIFFMYFPWTKTSPSKIVLPHWLSGMLKFVMNRFFFFFFLRKTPFCFCSSVIFSILKLTSGICCCCCVASVVSDSVRPHGLQPTRLLRPWDFPGKSTGVGCHCLLLQASALEEKTFSKQPR